MNEARLAGVKGQESKLSWRGHVLIENRHGLVVGSRLFLPVHVPGALLSIGDLHFAQGDGEVCISAIETGGTATVRVGLRRSGWRPEFPAWEAPPRPQRRFFSTTGIPLDDSGRNADRDLNLATRRALIELLRWLEEERGISGCNVRVPGKGMW